MTNNVTLIIIVGMISAIIIINTAIKSYFRAQSNKHHTNTLAALAAEETKRLKLLEKGMSIHEQSEASATTRP